MMTNDSNSEREIKVGTKLDQHFVDIGACQSGRDWVAENCATAAECWQKLLDEGRIKWLLWWYVRERGFDAKAESLARRMVMRSVEYAAKAMDAAKLPEQARTLRALPCTAPFAEIRYTAYAAAEDAYADADACWSAAYASACWSAAYASNAAALGFAADEQKQQIADILDILECPWTEGER